MRPAAATGIYWWNATGGRSGRWRALGGSVLFTSGFTKHVLSSEGRLAAGVRLPEKPYRRADLASAIAAALANLDPPA